jgi:hypothetical protein
MPEGVQDQPSAPHFSSSQACDLLSVGIELGDPENRHRRVPERETLARGDRRAPSGQEGPAVKKAQRSRRPSGQEGPAVKKAMAMGPEFREDPASISPEEQARR